MVRVTQKTEGTELGGIDLKRYSIFFFKWGGGGGEGGNVDHMRGQPDVIPAIAFWLTRSHVELFCNVVSRFEVFYFFKL